MERVCELEQFANPYRPRIFKHSIPKCNRNKGHARDFCGSLTAHKSHRGASLAPRADTCINLVRPYQATPELSARAPVDVADSEICYKNLTSSEGDGTATVDCTLALEYGTVVRDDEDFHNFIYFLLLFVCTVRFRFTSINIHPSIHSLYVSDLPNQIGQGKARQLFPSESPLQVRY